MSRHWGIPQPTRFERAAGTATAWCPGDKPGQLWHRRAEMDEPSAPLPYQPGPITFIATCALGFFLGWLIAAANPLSGGFFAPWFPL